MIPRRSSRRALVAAALLLSAPASLPIARPAVAQESPGWFVPSQQPPEPSQGAAARGRKTARPVPVETEPMQAMPPVGPEGGEDDQLTEAELQRKLANLPQPAVPPLPPLIAPLYADTASGDAVKVTASGVGAALPAPLTADATYYLIKKTDNIVQLAASAADAAAGTAITLENAGAGTLKLTAPVAHTGQTNVAADFTVTLPSNIKLLAGGALPPPGVMGVLGVPDVMRASSAAQAVDKVIGSRKEKLQAEAQRAEATWREMQQSLQNDAGRLTRDTVLQRERALQDRVRNDRRQLQAKQQVIQEAAQVALGQIERTLIQIIRQVAESRGMNLVLHRSQVALNMQEFDITEAVAAQLNKALPTVQIPPDGVDPTTLPKDWGSPTASK